VSPILGIVASSISGNLKAVTGGTLTSDATYYYRTFTSNGNLVVTGSVTMDYQIIAGGGSGGAGDSTTGSLTQMAAAGGGGAGGFLTLT